MLEILQYPFIVRAVIAGLILAALLASLGVYVMLRQMAFFADGIAHASLAGIALGLILAWPPLPVALVLSAIFALIIWLIEKKGGFSSDTGIGILFTSGMALGVLLMSFKSGYQPELISFLFGNILAVSQSDLIFIVLISLINFLFIIFYFRPLTIFSLNEELARTEGIKVDFLQPFFYVILALSVVLGIKILGVILVSAFLILPGATAQVLSASFRNFLLQALLWSELMTLGGIFISFFWDLPTGPVIVLVGTLFFSLSFLVKKLAK